MNKIFKSALLCGGLMTMFAACTNDNEPAVQGDSVLAVNARAVAIDSRAIVHGEKLIGDISVSLVAAADAGAYDGNEYLNLKYSSADGTAWTLDAGTAQPMLSSTAGKAVAFYPWADAPYTAVPVETGSETDYMYSGKLNDATNGGWLMGINNSAPTANFTGDYALKHALAAYRIYLQKEAAYETDATVTKIQITSDGFVENATLNALTGALAANTAAAPFTAVAADLNHVLDDAGKPADESDAGQFSELIVVPADAAATSLVFTITVKDALGAEKNYTAELTPLATTLAQGSIYEYTLTLTATGFTVGAVSVVDWTTVTDAQEDGEGSLTPAA